MSVYDSCSAQCMQGMNEKAIRNLKLAGEAIGAAASAAKVAAGIVQIGKPEDIAVVICVAAAASTVAAAHHVATNMTFVPAFTLKNSKGELPEVCTLCPKIVCQLRHGPAQASCIWLYGAQLAPNTLLSVCFGMPVN